MREFQGKKNTRRRLYSRPVLLILVLFLAVLLHGVWGAYQKMEFAKKKADEATRDLQSLQARAGVLSAQVTRDNTPQGKEEELREKFMVGEPGEGVIFLVDPREATSTDDATKKKSLWTRFLELF